MICKDGRESVPIAPVHTHRRLRRLLLFACLAALFGVAAFLLTGDILLHRAEPMVKAKIIAALSARFDSRVELDQFQISMRKGFEISGRGLRLYPHQLHMRQPMLQASSFSFRMLQWQELFRSTTRVDRVLVRGLTIRIPAPHQRANAPRRSPSAPGPDDYTRGMKIVISHMLIDRADLFIENRDPAKQPLHFLIKQLRLDSFAPGRPMKFHALLINPRPVGTIDSSGEFGPFNQEDPGETPVAGTYWFSHADLNSFKGIGGTLSSTGSYGGQLNRIEVNGQTRTPDFSLDIAHHPVPLNTTFHAVVDGTRGDTWLSPVDGWLDQTHIIATGTVVRSPSGEPGHAIQLDVRLAPGRMEDVLRLASDRQPALMNGRLQLHADLLLPPGNSSVTDRVHLSGSFAISGVHFTSAAVQEKVDELSLRGQGKVSKAKAQSDAWKAGNLRAATAANIASDMRGTFRFLNGRLSLTALNYQVPGAKIALRGDYDLNGQTLDFHGTARLDAHLSQMVTGWRSILLKPVDPFFAKNGAGTELPVSIGGTRADPQIGVKLR